MPRKYINIFRACNYFSSPYPVSPYFPLFSLLHFLPVYLFICDQIPIKSLATVFGDFSLLFSLRWETFNTSCRVIESIVECFDSVKKKNKLGREIMKKKITSVYICISPWPEISVNLIFRSESIRIAQNWNKWFWRKTIIGFTLFIHIFQWLFLLISVSQSTPLFLLRSVIL